STVLAVYGIITEQDIGKLFIAGIIPGLLAAVMYIVTISIIGYVRPSFLPEGPRATAQERLATARDIWAPLLLFVFVIGGLYGLLALIMLMYLVLGCLMDAMAMIILTIPIIFPVIVHLGFDPIWFGVIIVMTVELGLIHPPVGMNVFVIKSVVQDVSFSTIFK